jgi:GTP-binding protein
MFGRPEPTPLELSLTSRQFPPNGSHFLFSSSTSHQLLQHTSTSPTIFITGRSNSGKSSLVNTLTRTKSLMISSKTPGRTQLMNACSVGGGVLIDLPGYGYARESREKVERWNRAMGAVFTDRKRDWAKGLAVLLIDARRGGPTGIDMEFAGLLDHCGTAFMAVLTKCDAVRQGECEQAIVQTAKSMAGFKGTWVPLVLPTSSNVPDWPGTIALRHEMGLFFKEST